jgi:hypothetical protein
MRIATAALQSPSVGIAIMLDVMQGHSKVQLQVSMYSPFAYQLAIEVLLLPPSLQPKCYADHCVAASSRIDRRIDGT